MARRATLDRAVVAVLLVALLAVLSMGPVAGDRTAPAADAPTTLDRCTEITEPGVYAVGEGFAAGGFEPSRPCVRITADDVVLEGDGHALDGMGATNTTGVQVVGAENVTVRNLRVTDWQRGVHYRNAPDGEIRNVTATSNVYGVNISDSRGVTLAESNVSDNLVGLRIQGDTSTRFTGVVAASNRIAGIHEAVEIDGYGIEHNYGPPLDHDGDGRYEDVTGDGERTTDDRLALVVVVTADALGTAGLSDDQVRAFDFDFDGDLGFGDVLAF